MSTSEPVPSEPTTKANVEAPYVRTGDHERAVSELPSTRSADPDDIAPALAILSANQHNDSTLRVMPLPAPDLAAQRVRVLPMAPRSPIAPLIAIVSLLVAGLAIGAYFALPYAIDWNKSVHVPQPIDAARAPKPIVQQRAAGDAAPSIGGTKPKPKQVKGPKATKKKVGAAKKPRSQR